jgi:hypothetical protein
MGDGNLDQSLIDTIRETDLGSLAIDLGEVALDTVFEDGLLQDIPFIGAVAKLGSAGFTVRDRIFAKKLLLFITKLSEIPPDKRREMLDRLEDEKQRRKTGEKLLLLIDRMNDMDKPSMMARAFKAYLEGHIDRHQFDELAHIIDALNMATVETLKAAYRKRLGFETREPNPHVQHLAMCGLFSIHFNEIEIVTRAGDRHSLPERRDGGIIVQNVTGKLFCEIVLQSETNPLVSRSSGPLPRPSGRQE